MPALKNQTSKTIGRLIVGGLIVTGVIGGGIRLADFGSGGTESKITYVAQDFLNVYCSGTGGNVKTNNYAGTAGAKYDTCIVANPLASLTPSAGTGFIKSISLQVGNNPANVGLDCGFVKALNAGTGTEIFNNVLRSSGAYAVFSTGSLAWNGADYIKCGTLTNPTSSFSARLRIEYGDVYGE